MAALDVLEAPRQRRLAKPDPSRPIYQADPAHSANPRRGSATPLPAAGAPEPDRAEHLIFTANGLAG